MSRKTPWINDESMISSSAAILMHRSTTLFTHLHVAHPVSAYLGTEYGSTAE